MQHVTDVIGRGFLAAILVVMTMADGWGQERDWTKPHLTGPLLIEDQGSFFVGGVPKITDYAVLPAPSSAVPPVPVPQQIIVGQMYVQFQVPVKKYGGWPVVMVHGASHTGACLESTPDGREGWFPYFVRNGVPAYVVDQSGRGRSGFDQSVLNEAKARLGGNDTQRATELIPNFFRISDNHAWTMFFGHLVPRGSSILIGRLVPHGNAADPEVEAGHRAAPRFPIDIVDPHITLRVGAIGPAPAGPLASYALEYYKQLVPDAEVTLPGSTCATCDPVVLPPSETWTPQNLATLVERLDGAVVVTHSQSGIMGLHMTRILKERGHLHLLKGLVTIEGSCSLQKSGLRPADFDSIPFMALKADYPAGVSTDCQKTVDAITARRAGGIETAKADYLKLGEQGLPGVTHMMMLDKNNLQIADIIIGWVDRNVRPRVRDH